MIGFFDSGYGGLLIMKECLAVRPMMSAMYFGDNARAPYGSRSGQEIFQFTVEGVEFLFAQGCKLVILACNTASANALRRIQQEIVPRYPGHNVLGILVPTVEQISSSKVIGVFATPATVTSHAYRTEITHRNPLAQVVEIACPELVPRLEAGEAPEKLQPFVASYAQQLRQHVEPEAILLGCTHYPLLLPLFVQEFPQTPIHDQASIVAKSLEDYLTRHPEYVDDTQQAARYVTSGDPREVEKRAREIFNTHDIMFAAYAKP